MKDFFNKLVTSSADPTRYSLALKGVVLLAGGQVVHALQIACAFGIACLGVTMDLVNQIAQGFEMVAYGFLTVIGAVWFLYGLYRKWKLERWSHPNA